MEINDLIKALRSKTSRDNRELLDEAADVIELLYRMRDKEALSEEFKRRRGERGVGDVAPYEGTWIPTSERVPLRTDEYIVIIAYAEKATSLYYDASEKEWVDDLWGNSNYYRVSHWMEMPKMPKMLKEGRTDEG